MPGLSIPSTAPYDSIKTVLQFARVFANDAAGPAGLNGDLLASAVTTTPVYLNLGLRRLQDELLDAGVEVLGKEIIITGVTPVASADPGVTVYLDWENYYDGVNPNPALSLPFDLMEPMKLWQRPTGSTAFYPLEPAPSGLPNQYHGPQMLAWEWLNDKLYLNGATNTLDLKVRYSTYFPDVTLDDENVKIPLMRAGVALARFMVLEYCRTRGGVDIAVLESAALAEVAKITNRTAARKQQVIYRRQPRRY